MVDFQEAILNRVIGASTAGAKLGLRVLVRRILSPLLELCAILIGGCSHARGYQAVLDSQVGVLLDLRHALLQEFLQSNVAVFRRWSLVAAVKPLIMSIYQLFLYTVSIYLSTQSYVHMSYLIWKKEGKII